jgi:two-component system, cell cycle sensor histidine kinase and response regulator CckA
MKKNRLLLVLTLLLGLCALLLIFFYREAKREAIHNLNVQQSLHARQAAQGIEDFFVRWTGILTVLAKSPHVIDMDQTGRETIENSYQATLGQIRGITRVDAAGRIVYTAPFDRNLIGRDISYQNHVQEIMRTRKPAISDVFTAVQGYQTVALHVPVFKGGAFRGTIAVAIDFQALARRYLEVIKIGKTGYAWVTSRDGTELYCPVPGHTGKSVFINCEDFPSILAMVSEMLKGRQGITTYTFDQIGSQAVKTVKKHAVYMPISLGNTFWSIVVASSEDEVLASLADFRNRLMLLVALFLLGAVLFSYYGLKAWVIIREEEKRLEAETALRESEASFRSLIENAPEAIYVHADKQFLYMNHSAADFFGAKDTDQLIGSSLLERLPPGLHEMANERLRILYEERRSVPIIEQVFVRLDGSVVPAEASAVPIQYDHRNAALTFARDITERKRMDQALRESEETFRKAFYTSPDSININRMADGMYVSINEAFVRVTGYTEAETIGRTSAELDIWANPEDRLKLLAGLKSEGEVRNLDAAFRMKNGQIRYGLMSAVMIELKGVPHIISITRDITERKQAQGKLQESQALLSAVFDHVQAGIFLIDAATHRIVNANRMAAEMSGAKKEEMIGKTCHNYICPAAVGECPITDCGQSIDKAERVLLTMDGREIPVLKTAVPVRIAGQDYLLESFIDITESKRLASQLLEAQKMEAVGTLAGGIAHDFNNILMGIQGVASLMLLDFTPSQPQHERLKIIEDQVQRGADLTRQLLGFARGGRYEVKPTNINEIIEKSSSMFGRTRKEIAIYRKYEKEVWTLETDRGQMEQVFLNLYVNAWQAMPGGGTIYLETQNVILDGRDHLPGLNVPGRYVKISVGDTGMGMDRKTKERIFDPFFTTKSIGKGTGLGLAMVYGIIKGHGGGIHVTSEPGHGTTFHIYLPASDKTVVEEKAVPSAILKGTETILLVDDEKMVLEMSREILESLGYRVYAAASGQEAIAVFMEKRKEMDLVLLDMIMPGISGGETFDRLREIHPGIAVLLSSGYSINGQAQEILNRGCRGFLQKPFTLELLSRKIREILDV